MNEYFESTQIIKLERTLLMTSPWVIQGSSGWGLAGWVGKFESSGFLINDDGVPIAESIVYTVTIFPIDQQTFLLNEPLAIFAVLVKKEGSYLQYTTWGNREHIQRWIKSEFDCECFLMSAGN
jgi:hypothetical protein